MKTKLFALLTVLLSLSAFSAREHTIQIDLKKPKNSIRLNFTESTDATVKAEIKRAGSDFDISEWDGLLWLGDESGGVTITNSTAYKGGMDWTISDGSMPTNGRYTVILFGANGDTLEPWGKGVVTVDENDADNSLPLEWNKSGYIYDIATNATSVSALAYIAGTNALANTADKITATTGTNIAQAVVGVYTNSIAANSATGAVNTAAIAVLNSATDTLDTAVSILNTAKVDRVWSSSTNYMDGDGVRYEITASDNYVFVINSGLEFPNGQYPLMEDEGSYFIDYEGEQKTVVMEINVVSEDPFTTSVNFLFHSTYQSESWLATPPAMPDHAVYFPSGDYITPIFITNVINRFATTNEVYTKTESDAKYALQTNVLELSNTTAFTPDADYEPATKKYVDDNAGGVVEGDEVLSTGELVTKFLRADGDGTSSWIDPFVSGIHLGDNVNLYLGDGDDAAIYFDGTDLNINPENVGSGVTRHSTDVYVGPSIRLRHDLGIVYATRIQQIAGGQLIIGGTSGLLVSADGTTKINNDTSPLLFGSGQDVGVNFDGADMNIYSANVTANDELNFTDFDAYNFDGDSITITTSKTPASATATGTTGQIAWDSDYIYICVDTDTWKRVAISTW